MAYTIRQAVETDLPALLALYAQLKPGESAAADDAATAAWAEMLANPCMQVLVAQVEGVPRATCTLVVLPNLTHGRRPYALVENVVCDAAFRRQGLGLGLLHAARERARQAGCYKLMLLTGSKEAGTLRFYERAGYNRADKTGFVQWL